MTATRVRGVEVGTGGTYFGGKFASFDGLRNGRFTNGDRYTIAPLVNDLLNADHYLVLADFDAYSAAQSEAGIDSGDITRWSSM